MMNYAITVAPLIKAMLSQRSKAMKEHEWLSCKTIKNEIFPFSPYARIEIVLHKRVGARRSR